MGKGGGNAVSMRSSKPITALIAWLIVAVVFGSQLLFLSGCDSSDPGGSASSQGVSASATSPADGVQYTFRKNSYLKEHFKKHGKKMGYADAQAYLAGANAVINNPKSLHKLEAEDGDDVYYLEATDEIVFVSSDGYIRTYFNPGGIDYYYRQ